MVEKSSTLESLVVMRILVTGVNGYIGKVLVNILNEQGVYIVDGCDLNLYSTNPPQLNYYFEKDFRLLTINELRKYKYIIHLAAISNDPMGELNSELTSQVNGYGTIELAEKAKHAGVEVFIFSSSCSVYGKSGTESINENGDILPLSEYAKSKIIAEKGLTKIADDRFFTLSLRNATAFGFSPSFRSDLAINDFICSAVFNSSILIKSDGNQFRPFLHTIDMSRIFLGVMKNLKLFSDHNGKFINSGFNSGNFQIKEITEIIKKIIPDITLKFSANAGSDPRDYRVSFDLLQSILPNLRPEYPLESGINDLVESIRLGFIKKEKYEKGEYVRLNSLKVKGYVF